MEIRKGYYYSEDHEWVKVEGDRGLVGITDYAQHHLGDIVFVELPEIDAQFSAGSSIGTIESVKAVADMHTPVSGTVVEVNEDLEGSPELLNQDPYGQHIAVFELSDPGELDKLMSPEEYEAFCAKLD